MPTLHLDIILHKALQALKFTAISQSKGNSNGNINNNLKLQRIYTPLPYSNGCFFQAEILK